MKSTGNCIRKRIKSTVKYLLELEYKNKFQIKNVHIDPVHIRN